MTDIIVIGAGPAGVLAALRAAELGARTVLVTSGEFGGMAANDGPVPVRVLAHAAQLIREWRQFVQYGLTAREPVLDYPRLLARVREVVTDVSAHSSLRRQLDSLGVTVHENVGAARFADPRTIETESGLRLQAGKLIICTGGVSRRLPIPGFELTSTHSDVWRLTAIPPSMLVVGSGASGVQVASIFHAFGSRVQLFEAGPRILPSEDEDVSAAVAAAFRASDIVVRESFGTIESFEKTPAGVRMHFSKDGRRGSAEAALAVMAVGWVADTAGLNLAAAGVETERRGFVMVDEYLRTSAPFIFAAGDITGRLMLVPQALQAGFVAATNAVLGPTLPLEDEVSPIGSFTDPEYAQVGLTEKKAREAHDVVTAVVHFDSTVRTIIDGRTFGFCKLITDRKTCRILGCHVVGERAVDIIQVAAVAMAAGMRVDELARVALSFPTYTGILSRVAVSAAHQLNLTLGWQAYQAERTRHPLAFGRITHFSTRRLTMFNTKNDLSEATRAKVVELLNARLADCTDLQTQAKQAHWNVKGPNFIALHELFDKINEDVEDYVDNIAERVVQLGGVAEGTARTVAKRSSLSEYPANAVDGRSHVQALSTALATFGAAARKGINDANDLGDFDTADLFTEVSRGMDKWLWFVEAHLQAER